MKLNKQRRNMLISTSKCRSWLLWKSFKHIHTANEEAVFKSILLVSLNNNSTLIFVLDNSGLKIGNCCWFYSCPCFLLLVIKNVTSMDKKWSSSFTGRVLTLSFAISLSYNKWKRVFSLICICTWLLLYKIGWASNFHRCLIQSLH